MTDDLSSFPARVFLLPGGPVLLSELVVLLTRDFSLFPELEGEVSMIGDSVRSQEDEALMTGGSVLPPEDEAPTIEDSIPTFFDSPSVS